MSNTIFFEMNQLEFWIVTSAIGGIIWYGVRRVISSIDKVSETVQQLSIDMKIHTEQIKNVINTVSEHKEDFKDLSHRVDEIERIQNKCMSCNDNK